MSASSYPLPDIGDDARRLTIGWIWLGIYALLAAGILSLMLALSRTPVIQDFMPGGDFFYIALVVHVDLSVLIWFLACAGILWSVLGAERKTLWHKLAFYLAVAGTVMISISPFVGADKPLMNNYVPVLQHPWFYNGLLVVTAGLVLQAGVFMFNNRPNFRHPSEVDTLRFALFIGALAALLAVVCIAIAYLKLPADIEGEYYFDLLFWGGGHVLQFVHTLMMLIAWVLLAGACGSRMPFKPSVGMLLFGLALAPLLVVPWFYQYPVESSEQVLAFTALMRKGGLASIPLGLLITLSLFGSSFLEPRELPLRAALITSVTLFAAGGVIGFLIIGSNTVIPAHYHGSIVGVTLALMGVIYYLLPRLGYPIRRSRMAYWQPYLYGGGQLMHITALAWSGSHGVKRKTAGEAQGLESLQEIVGMGLMGLGGLIAVIGGLLFLIVVISALRAKRQEPAL